MHPCWVWTFRTSLGIGNEPALNPERDEPVAPWIPGPTLRAYRSTMPRITAHIESPSPLWIAGYVAALSSASDWPTLDGEDLSDYPAVEDLALGATAVAPLGRLDTSAAGVASLA